MAWLYLDSRYEETLTDEFMKSLPHPWVFSEDAHANLDRRSSGAFSPIYAGGRLYGF